MGRHRRLDQSLTAAADPLTADMALDLEHAGGVIKFLAHILADALELAAAAALSVLGFVSDFLPREGRRKRHTAWLCPRRRHLLLQRFDFETDGLDVGIDAFIQQ